MIHFPPLSIALGREEKWVSASASEAGVVTDIEATALTAVRSELFSHRYALLRLFNLELSACFDLINWNTAVSRPIGALPLPAACSELVDLLSRCRGLIFSWVKEAFVQRAIASTSADATATSSKFELVISRSRALKFAVQGETDCEGRWSVFGQVFRRVHGMPSSVLRRTGQLWETVFAGERSHDSGGPYREAWSAMVADLMSPVLPLLKPCPNNEGKVGMNQDTWVLNPDCVRSNTHMEMLVFFGKLMGSAARSNNYLDLYLSPLVWKLLVRQNVTLDDIRDVDLTAVNQLLMYRRRRDLTEDTFPHHDLHYCTTNKGGSLVELRPGGAQVR